MRKSQQIGRIIADLVCLGLVFLPCLCLQFAGKPYKRGFFCDDESINHPYKDSTITTEVMTVVGLALPILSFLISEGIHFAVHKRNGMANPPYMIGDKPIPFLVYQYYKIIGIFLFGAAFQQTVVNIAKFSIGRLRPHFLAVCDPDYSKFNCTDNRGYMLYVEGDYCRGTHADEEKLLEMRLSFISGHASFSCYAMVYMALYLHARFTWKGSKLLCPLLQCIVLMMAIFCCLSRVSDYKHHWSDVLAGAFFGTLVACVSVVHYTDLFLQKKLTEMKTSREDFPREMNDVKLTTVNSRPISRITYLTDENTQPYNDHPDTYTNQRNFYNMQP